MNKEEQEDRQKFNEDWEEFTNKMGKIPSMTKALREYREFMEKHAADFSEINSKLLSHELSPEERNESKTKLSELNGIALDKVAAIYEARYKIDNAKKQREINKQKRENLSLKQQLARQAQELAKQSNYHIMAESPEYNKIIGLFNRDTFELAARDENGMGVFTSDDFLVNVVNIAKTKLLFHESAALLLECLVIKATQSGLRKTQIILSLDEYMKMRGLTDRNRAAQQVRDDIHVLIHTTFFVRMIYPTHIKKYGKALIEVPISGGGGANEERGRYANGDIIFWFSEIFFEMLRVNEKKSKTPYLWARMPKAALAQNLHKYPYSFWLGRKIGIDARIRKGEHGSGKLDKNSRIIESVVSVQALLDSVPNIPTVEEAEKRGRHFWEDIILPFSDSLNALSEAFEWEFVNDTKEDIDFTKFQNFRIASIRIFWKEPIDYSSITKGRTKRPKAITEAKAKTDK